MNPQRPVLLGQSQGLPTGSWRIPASIVVGSLLTILPVIATMPFMPPFGLLMLLGWRLRRADAIVPWAVPLLGLFDDMISGQPMGSAMLLWTLCFLAIDVLDTRLVWRDYWHDFFIASGAIGFCLIVGRLFATPLSAHVDTILLIQIVVSIGLTPLIAGLCAAIDVKRAAR